MMDNVQADCKAFEANTSCTDKELRIEKLKLLTKKAENGRIVGGETLRNPLPWILMIHFADEQCGGSIINAKFILSAAHCICSPSNFPIFCSRQMGDVQPSVPITIKVSEICITGVVIYINTTKTGFDFYFDTYHILADMHHSSMPVH
ncbi:chymotrypsin-like elastase family member 2A [Eurytemora carolleeae]|uniref:chymotrypsin-like elastase family member 2A n=1 Tax=Eurytemora carolleeae TaxID=1294199 RepID=UPI000C790617|nr:chymotrypsin-like elastase family member 2A [Eurytemora carolleeae]|eukprot:XP_023341104.1 chymotrypsin-like elastase family member 2A [Eurytemora affinis]